MVTDTHSGHLNLTAAQCFDQQRTELQNAEQTGVKQPMFRAFLMMMGEYTNLFIFGALMASDSRRFYHFLLLTNEAKDRQVSFRSSKLWMVATSLLNTAGSPMHLTALLLLPPSTYSTVTRVQMLSSAHLMFSTVISRLLLGRPILRHFYLASRFAILGFITVSFSLTVDK